MVVPFLEENDKEKKVTSIIILVQDRYDYFQRCIDSIFSNTKSKFELVLILQAILDPRIIRDVEQLRTAQNENFHLIVQENTVNNGVTPGRNQGMALATGDYLLFFDDDAYISEDLEQIPEKLRHLDWLERMIYFFDNHHGVGVVGQSGSYINPLRKGIFWQARVHDYCDVVQGYCFMFSREVLNTIGYLDEAFGKFWHEESEYALRAKHNGFRVVNCGYIGVTHYGSGSGDDGTYVKKIDYLFDKWSPMFDTILEYNKDCWTTEGLKENANPRAY